MSNSLTNRLKKLVLAQNFRAFVIIFTVLLVIYAVPFAAHRNQNPILQRSGLARGVEPGIISGQSTIDPNDGFTSQALGHAAAESWLHGHIPYWNHNEGVGMPLIAGMQSAAMLPLTLVLHFYDGVMLFHFLLQLLAGYMTYLFLRRLKVRFSLAVLGGVLFALNGAFAWLTNAAFNPIAFLPMLLLGMECAFGSSEKKKPGGWFLIAAALSLSLYAGFPETAFINAIFAYGWAAIRLLQLKPKLRKPYIVKIAVGSVVGLLLTAPLLIAFTGYLPYTQVAGHAGGGYAHFSLPFSTLPALFMPYVFGPIFGFVANGKPVDLFIFWSNVGGYLTVPLVLMALIGVYAKRPRSIKLYLLAFALIVILKNYGFKPVTVLINLIPGMNQVAFYRYSIPALSMALIILAMFGAEAFVKSEVRKKKVLGLTAATVIFVGVLAVVSRGLLHQLGAFPSHKIMAVMSLVWALSIVVMFALVFLKPRLRLIGVILLLGIDAVAMYSAPLLSLPKIAAIDTKPVSFLQQNLGDNRFYTLHPIAPNYGSYFQVASININDLPIPKNWYNYVPEKLDHNTSALVFTGYSRSDAGGPTALDEFATNQAAYQNLSVKYLVTDRDQVSDQFAADHGLTKVFEDEGVQIFQLAATRGYFDATNCTFANQTKDRVDTNCPIETPLLRRELFMPGWQAKVNGQSRAVKQDQDIFQTVSVPAGKSTVSFNYSPPHIMLGYAAFAVGVLAVAGGLLMRVPDVRKSRAGAYGLRVLRTLKLK